VSHVPQSSHFKKILFVCLFCRLSLKPLTLLHNREQNKTLESFKVKIFATLASLAAAMGPQFPAETPNSQFYLSAVSQALSAAHDQVRIF